MKNLLVSLGVIASLAAAPVAFSAGKRGRRSYGRTVVSAPGVHVSVGRAGTYVSTPYARVNVSSYSARSYVRAPYYRSNVTVRTGYYAPRVYWGFGY